MRYPDVESRFMYQCEYTTHVHATTTEEVVGSCVIFVSMSGHRLLAGVSRLFHTFQVSEVIGFSLRAANMKLQRQADDIFVDKVSLLSRN